MDRNKKRLRSSLLAAASLALLAGCMGEASQTGDDIKQKVNEAGNSISHSIQDIASNVGEELQSRSGRLEKSVSASMDQVAADSALEVDNQVGQIEIKPSTGNALTAEAVISSQDKKAFHAEREAILEEATVSITAEDNEIRVHVHPKGDPSKDLWDWAEEKYGFSDFSIDYIIEVPESLTVYNLENNVGNIKLQELAGAFQIKTDVGNVEMDQTAFTDDSVVTSNTGEIELDIASLADKASLKAKTDIGSLNAHLAKALKCTLDVSTDVGEITGAAKGESKINGGGPELSLSTDVGAINVSQS
ncbi:DUF4097 family beta strand repeat-containing protein [Paenibacillus caui]|uniref:DUF4097 family beta strand repeat-containing protein n=1 Tax=Paenibacillus caui TaxID=2873927 RepID=UPI001CA86BB2|nr:DUF4097 family beta strand repeat-containing protein [Paenibacillus caui]